MKNKLMILMFILIPGVVLADATATFGPTATFYAQQTATAVAATATAQAQATIDWAAKGTATANAQATQTENTLLSFTPTPTFTNTPTASWTPTPTSVYKPGYASENTLAKGLLNSAGNPYLSAGIPVTVMNMAATDSMYGGTISNAPPTPTPAFSNYFIIPISGQYTWMDLRIPSNAPLTLQLSYKHYFNSNVFTNMNVYTPTGVLLNSSGGITTTSGYPNEYIVGVSNAVTVYLTNYGSSQIGYTALFTNKNILPAPSNVSSSASTVFSGFLPTPTGTLPVGFSPTPNPVQVVGNFSSNVQYVVSPGATQTQVPVSPDKGLPVSITGVVGITQNKDYFFSATDNTIPLGSGLYVLPTPVIFATPIATTSYVDIQGSIKNIGTGYGAVSITVGNYVDLFYFDPGETRFLTMLANISGVGVTLCPLSTNAGVTLNTNLGLRIR